MKTGLCVIFNHPFRQQLPLLRELYGLRFKRILFLHPLDPAVRSDRDVQVTFGGGYSFDAMIANAGERIMREFWDFDNVLFAHNDLLLNPSFTEYNFSAKFGMDKETIVSPGIDNIGGALTVWMWAARAAAQFARPEALFGGGVFSSASYLPAATAAQAKAVALGLDPRTTVSRPAPDADLLPDVRIACEMLFGPTNTIADLGYPLFSGYSDFFAVPVSMLPQWLDTLGVLSAMHLFPEVSIPTTHVLTAGRLVNPNSVGMGMKALWGEARKGGDDPPTLDACFKSGDAFVHPVKFNRLTAGQMAAIRTLFSAHTRPYEFGYGRVDVVT